MTNVTDHLTKVLADTFVLYFKTHSFHWNVEGPQFKALHDLFGEQYTEMWEATDELAERIRALNSYSPDNFASLIELSNLKEAGQTPSAEDMIRLLKEDHEAIVKETLYPALRAAEEEGDEATVDMIIERIEVHDKAAWMLRSLAV